MDGQNKNNEQKLSPFEKHVKSLEDERARPGSEENKNNVREFSREAILPPSPFVKHVKKMEARRAEASDHECFVQDQLDEHFEAMMDGFMMGCKEIAWHVERLSGDENGDLKLIDTASALIRKCGKFDEFVEYIINLRKEALDRRKRTALATIILESGFEQKDLELFEGFIFNKGKDGTINLSNKYDSDVPF